MSDTSGWYISEIQDMMYGLGDCRRPLLDSVKLIEKIVHQQLTSILFQASEIASMNNVKIIGLNELLFLMRHDRNKLKRLIKYLCLKDLKTSVSKTSVRESCDIAFAMPNSLQEVSNTKRRSLCIEFLKTIDCTGEFLSMLSSSNSTDEIKLERELRADIKSQLLSPERYLEYAEARRTSFCKRFKLNRFRDWVIKDNCAEMKLSAVALEILHYLAYETVAQIVDLALLVKKDAFAVTDNPLLNLMPYNCVNPDFPFLRKPELFKSSGKDISGDDAHKPQLDSSPSSPGSVGKSSTMNRKKIIDTSISRKLTCQTAITPSEIYEALRRFCCPFFGVYTFIRSDIQVHRTVLTY